MFVTVFATAIAITKDLPDIEGDRKYNISTFASRLGVRRVALLGSGLLLANYLFAVVLAVSMPGAFRSWVMGPAHAVLGAALVYNTAQLDASKYSQQAIKAFYAFVWTLFYSEYALLPWI